MPAVINDVDSLARFRGQLNETSDNLREQLRKTEQSIETVAQGWKDSQFDKFKEDFEKDKDIIEPLCKEIDEFEAEILYPLEKTLRKYLALS